VYGIAVNSIGRSIKNEIKIEEFYLLGCSTI
jgi:hypothetical protein